MELCPRRAASKVLRRRKAGLRAGFFSCQSCRWNISLLPSGHSTKVPFTPPQAKRSFKHTPTTSEEHSDTKGAFHRMETRLKRVRVKDGLGSVMKRRKKAVMDFPSQNRELEVK